MRNLRLRKNLTGSVKRPKTVPTEPPGSLDYSESLTLSQAVDRYLQEPPPLPRLRTKTRPPKGYARHGPKDVLETIAEYLQVEAPEAQEQHVQASTSSKAGHDQKAHSGPVQRAYLPPARRRDKIKKPWMKQCTCTVKTQRKEDVSRD